MRKLIGSLIILVLVLLVSYYQDTIQVWLISNTKINWSYSYWLPKIGVLFLSIWGICILPIKHTLKYKIPLQILLLALLLGISFALKPIYLEDLNKEGITITPELYQQNLTIDAINNKYPTFEGVISIASTTCPHCMVAAKKLNILKLRKPEIDVLFIMFTLQQDKLDEFRNESQSFDIEYILAPEEKGVLEICQGSFPTFVYLKDGKIIHQWTNNEFGYPAYGWIENGLN